MTGIAVSSLRHRPGRHGTSQFRPMKSVITATLVVCVFTVGTLLFWNHSTRRDPRSIWNHERDVNRATAVVKSTPRKIARLVDVYVFESLSLDNEHNPIKG